MEIILVYLAVATLILAIAGLFVPQKLVFWCASDDRSRAMAFTAYLTLSIVLSIAFIIVVPEPPLPAPPVEKFTELPQPAPLTGIIFLKEVEERLGKMPNFAINEFELTLLDFGEMGASCELLSSSYPNHEIAVQHATQAVEAMVATFKAHEWKMADPILVECQIQIDSPDAASKDKVGSPIGFARYEPDTGKINWTSLQ